MTKQNIITLQVTFTLFLLLLNCNSPTESPDFYSAQDILYESQIVENDYWDINLNWIKEDLIIQCWVRIGPGYMWITPEWYLSNRYIRIKNNSYFQYEYLITGISP